MTLLLHLRRPPSAAKQRKDSSRAPVWKGHDLGGCGKIHRCRQNRGRAALQGRVSRLGSLGLQPLWSLFLAALSFFRSLLSRALESLEMCLRFQRLRCAFRTFRDFLRRPLQPCCERRRMNMASDRWRLLPACTCFPQPTAEPWRDDHASQIVEFAVSLPLLLVFVVGIFDFSGAFTLKQKLTDAARDAARAAAADPANDLSGFSGTAPLSVIDAFQIVDNFLKANNINDCGIATATPTSSALTWTYSASGSTSGCPGTGLSITINRGYYFPSNSTAAASIACSPTPPGGQTAVLATCVTISYAYSWRFDRVITLLGSRASVPTSITATAVAMNEN